MKLVKLCLLALALALCGAACRQPAANQNAANTNTAKAQTPPGATPAATLDLSTPTKAALTFYQGVREKDTAKIKSTLSQGALAEAEKQSPGNADKTIMDAVQQSAAPPAASLDMRNEKINGDKATLEVVGLDEKDKNKAETYYFVKEGNAWKVDLFHEDDKPGKK